MPRKRKNAPPPWFEPLKEWVREVRFALTSNGHCDEAEALRLLMRDRGDEIARLMRGFRSGAVPATLPSADSWRAPPKLPPPDLPLDRAALLLPVLRVELKRRAILNDLLDDKRRHICAAGGVIWTAYHAHQHKTRLERGGPRDLNHVGDIVGIERVTLREESKAHALAVAGKTLVAMKALYGHPRYRLTQSVVKFFTGEDVLYEQLRELWKRLA